ncbi:MAG: AbrB/MazE/SpoVT family DNA-binding domain-containing protein [Ruminococcaceae bacterium]|nr:AbrB/MazE/SpoVT family DNA-binding domain-containing protein [Oscillospiraceae bacterium]
MKNEVDALGRFVIPIKYRRKMNIHPGDELDVKLSKETLYIKKSYPVCIFCEETEELVLYEEKMLCKKCIGNIRKLTP